MNTIRKLYFDSIETSVLFHIFFVEYDPFSQYDPIFVTKAQMIDKGHVFLVIPPKTFHFDVSDVKKVKYLSENSKYFTYKVQKKTGWYFLKRKWMNLKL